MLNANSWSSNFILPDSNILTEYMYKDMIFPAAIARHLAKAFSYRSINLDNVSSTSFILLSGLEILNSIEFKYMPNHSIFWTGQKTDFLWW